MLLARTISRCCTRIRCPQRHSNQMSLPSDQSHRSHVYSLLCFLLTVHLCHCCLNLPYLLALGLSLRTELDFQVDQFESQKSINRSRCRKSQKSGSVSSDSALFDRSSLVSHPCNSLYDHLTKLPTLALFAICVSRSSMVTT